VTASINGVSAPDPYLYIRSGGTIIGLYLYPSSPTLQGLNRINSRIGRQLLGFYRSHRTSQVTSALSSVTHDHHFLQRRGVFHHSDINNGLVANLNPLGQITYKGKYQRGALRYGQ